MVIPVEVSIVQPDDAAEVCASSPICEAGVIGQLLSTLTDFRDCRDRVFVDLLEEEHRLPALREIYNTSHVITALAIQGAV